MMLEEDKYVVSLECSETGGIPWIQQHQESLTFSWPQNITLQLAHASVRVCTFIEALYLSSSTTLFRDTVLF